MESFRFRSVAIFVPGVQQSIDFEPACSEGVVRIADYEPSDTFGIVLLHLRHFTFLILVGCFIVSASLTDAKDIEPYVVDFIGGTGIQNEVDFSLSGRDLPWNRRDIDQWRFRSPYVTNSIIFCVLRQVFPLN